jgi:hypothetical protein
MASRVIPFLGADIAQIDRQTSTAGVEFMDSALNALIVALTAIRDQADSVLKKIDNQNEKDPFAGSAPVVGTQTFYSSRAGRSGCPMPEMRRSSF